MNGYLALVALVVAMALLGATGTPGRDMPFYTGVDTVDPPRIKDKTVFSNPTFLR